MLCQRGGGEGGFSEPDRRHRTAAGRNDAARSHERRGGSGHVSAVRASVGLVLGLSGRALRRRGAVVVSEKRKGGGGNMSLDYFFYGMNALLIAYMLFESLK